MLLRVEVLQTGAARFHPFQCHSACLRQLHLRAITEIPLEGMVH